MWEEECAIQSMQVLSPYGLLAPLSVYLCPDH